MGIITKAAKAFNEINWDKVGIFTGGVLFGTAGIKILSSKDAKKVYTQTTAAAMRAQSCVMKTVTKVRENCDDIVMRSAQLLTSTLKMLRQKKRQKLRLKRHKPVSYGIFVQCLPACRHCCCF